MHSLGTNEIKEEPPKEEIKVEPPKEEIKKEEVKANGTAESLGTYSIGNIKD